MMLPIKIDEIPEGGLDLDESFDEEWIKLLLMPQYHSAGEKIHIHIHIEKHEKNVFTKGFMKTNLLFICSRCGEDAPYVLEQSFQHIYVQSSEKGKKNKGNIDSSEIEISFIDVNTIDLEPLIAEEFVLSLPTYPLCREDCKGICQFCKTNLNEKQCFCSNEVVDPRWEKLKLIKLKKE